jgi:hypothetical protein
MVQPNAAAPCRLVFRSASCCCDAALNRFDQCSTEGSEENLNRRQQRKRRRIRGGSPSWSSGRAFGVSSIVLIVLAESPNALEPQRRRRPYRITIAETQSPMCLCFLCCRLFKIFFAAFVRTRAIHSHRPRKKERPNWSIWPF